MTIYNATDAWNPGEFPAILAIGDSWFWYPRNNLLEAIARCGDQLYDGYQHMVRIGRNGALMIDYVDLPGRPGRYAADLNANLDPAVLKYYSVLLISGAGNDAVDYKLCVKQGCGAFTRPEDCIDPAGLQRFITDVTRDLGILLHETIAAFHGLGRSPKVILHGYDYAVPDGRGFTLTGIPVTGPWLKPVLDTCGVNPDLGFRSQVVRLLIDRLNATFAQYADAQSGIYFVDSRGTLDSGANYTADWDNELHPTASGFDRIVRQRWLPVLRQAGIAR